MTKTARQLVSELESALEELPESEQEECITSYLEDLRQRAKAREGRGTGQAKKPLYEPFQLMLDANLDLPPDYSETYEEHLYGPRKHDD